ncbi:MAG: sodium/solute symporter [Gemmatimonadetes bacterium]|nr:sodium/solute symporter [Gemmatimonadota bacterium]
MTWILDHWLVLLMLAGYTGLMVYHALAGKRQTKGVTDYYVGGRSMGGIALGISFFATYSSTNSFVGFSGQAYTYGAPWLLLTVTAVTFSFIAWKWITPRLRDATELLNSVTIPDFIGFRFGSNAARVGAAIIVVFASFLYMTAVFKGIGNLLEAFLDVPYEVAILIVFVIVMIYTAVGGFISVVKTDVVQGIVMMIAAVLLFTGTVHAASGLGSLAALKQSPETAKLFSWDAAMPFPVLFGVMVAGTMKFIVEPRQLARFYALRDRKAIRSGIWVSTLAFLGVYALLMPIGLYAHNILPPGTVSDTDLIIPTMLSGGEVFGPGVAAFLLVAMVAAAMSSLDSVLLVTGSTCARDIVGLVRPAESEAALMRLTRWLVALLALITALIALRPPGSIVTLTVFSGSLYAACFFPVIVLGLFWRPGNGTSAIASFVVGVVTLLGWKYLPFGANIHEVFPAVLFSTVVYAVTAHLGTSHQAAEVDELFA